MTTTTAPMTTTETAGALRALTAYHEAGHTVAGVMRGSVLRSVRLGEVDGDGLTIHRGPPWDQPFSAYAGPWAEARYTWGDRPADAEDEDGLVFADHLYGIFLGVGAEDRQELRQHFAELAAMLPEVSADDLERATEQTWARELEAVWTAIEATATRLLAGAEITDESVGDAIRVCLMRSLRELA